MNQWALDAPMDGTFQLGIGMHEPSFDQL